MVLGEHIHNLEEQRDEQLLTAVRAGVGVMATEQMVIITSPVPGSKEEEYDPDPEWGNGNHRHPMLSREPLLNRHAS